MTTLRAAEASDEARSVSLTRELGVPELVLTQMEQHDFQQPEDDVRRPQLRGNADTRQTHDEEDLPSAAVEMYLDRLMPRALFTLQSPSAI